MGTEYTVVKQPRTGSEMYLYEMSGGFSIGILDRSNVATIEKFYQKEMEEILVNIITPMVYQYSYSYKTEEEYFQDLVKKIHTKLKEKGVIV